MSKLKGKKKLNKAISAPLVKRFGITKARLSDEYCCYFDTESITFKAIENEETDKMFTDFIKERFNYVGINSFIMSILHEIGHLKANDDVSGEVYDFCLAEKARIEQEMESCYMDSEKVKALEWQYFTLPDEIMATQWAVNYAKNHPRIVKKLWVEMSKALNEFYKANGIEGD